MDILIHWIPTISAVIFLLSALASAYTTMRTNRITARMYGDMRRMRRATARLEELATLAESALELRVREYHTPTDELVNE